MRDIRNWTCGHSLTTEIDEEGDAICLRCGCVVQLRFNMRRFKEQMRKIGEG
jgi:transcription initiation factor TFIIIB Brf1 subunit/transcription initiation factor TFIIB